MVLDLERHLGAIPKRRCKQKAEFSFLSHGSPNAPPWVAQTPGWLANPDLVGLLLARGPPWHWKPETVVCTGEWMQCTRPETRAHMWVHRHALAYTEMY